MLRPHSSPRRLTCFFQNGKNDDESGPPSLFPHFLADMHFADKTFYRAINREETQNRFPQKISEFEQSIKNDLQIVR